MVIRETEIAQDSHKWLQALFKTQIGFSLARGIDREEVRRINVDSSIFLVQRT